MSRVIRVELSTTGIDRAIRELRDYQRWLERKTAELRRRVAELMQSQAQSAFNNAIADDLINEGAIIGGVNVEVEDGDNVTVVVANGKDAVFIEFGAGVYHNGPVGSSPNPLGENLSFTIGSYGKGNGARQVWGYYDEGHNLHLTHGAPASMPMYNAEMAVIRNIADIAREVFQS